MQLSQLLLSTTGTMLNPKNINLPHFIHLANSFDFYSEQFTKRNIEWYKILRKPVKMYNVKDEMLMARTGSSPAEPRDFRV